MRARRPRPSEKTTSCPPRPFPARPPGPGWPPRRRGGLCTPVNGPGRYRGIAPLSLRPFAQPLAGNEMPRHAYSLATRTRGAHPSDKTALGALSNLSPLGDGYWACPLAEGRAPHAREESPRAHPGMSLLIRQPVASVFAESEAPRNVFGHPRRTLKVPPSQRISVPASPGPQPQGLDPFP